MFRNSPYLRRLGVPTPTQSHLDRSWTKRRTTRALVRRHYRNRTYSPARLAMPIPRLPSPPWSRNPQPPAARVPLPTTGGPAAATTRTADGAPAHGDTHGNVPAANVATTCASARRSPPSATGLCTSTLENSQPSQEQLTSNRAQQDPISPPPTPPSPPLENRNPRPRHSND